MITEMNVQQMQLASSLIRNYGYAFANKDRDTEIWLTSRNHELYPVIRICSCPVNEQNQDIERLHKMFREYAHKATDRSRLLDIHICTDTEFSNPEGIETTAIQPGRISGHNIDSDFPGISRQLKPVYDAQNEYEALTADLKEFEKYKPKVKKIRKENNSAPIVTYIVLGICIAVFLLIKISGFDGNDTEKAILYGAYYKPFILAGEWWRLLTAGFVHTQIWHILMNMMSLVSLGFALEKYFGRLRYAVILLLSVIAGSLTVFAFEGNIITVGISGGLYGLMGAYIAIAVMNGHLENPSFRNSLFRIVGINLLINFIPGIAYYAHIGGLICGAVLGILFSGYLANKKWRIGAMAAGAVLTAVLLIGSINNAKISSSAVYLGTDLKILQYESDHGLNGYAEWLSKGLGDVYGISLTQE